jgi:hypothetical protein
MMSRKAIRILLSALAVTALCLGAMLLSSCNTAGEDGHTYLKLHVDSSWLNYDSVQVLLDRGDGSEPQKIFGGKVISAKELERIQADGYDGGKVAILIRAYEDGLVIREENRNYDGSSQKTLEVVVVRIPDPGVVTSKDGLHLALAPKDTLISVKDTVAFTAQCRNDSGQVAEADWDFDGDGTVDLAKTPGAAAALLKESHRFDVAGVYHASLTLKGSQGATLSAQVTVTVVEDKPTASAGPDTTVPVSTDLLLVGTARDSLGRIVKREWQIGTNPSVISPDGKITFKTPASPGNVIVVFRATDDDGFQAEDTAVVHVTAVKDSSKDGLHLAISPKDTLISIRDSVTFTAAAKNDNGKITKEEWDVDGDGTADIIRNPDKDSATLKAGFRFAKAGTYFPALAIASAKGATLAATVSVKVIEDKPVADAGNDISVVTGAAVALTGSGKDSLGKVVKMEWKFADGDFAATTDGKASFTAPAVPGTVKAVFRVTDDDDLTGEDTVNVNVVSPAMANLTQLAVQGCPLSPAFNPDTLTYGCAAPFSATSVTVTAKAQGTMTLNGKALADGAASDPIALASGKADLAIVVVNGASTKSYAVKVATAAASGNNALKSLTLSAGSLTPAFAADNSAYTVTVASTVTSLSLTAIVADTTASLAVQAAATKSGAASAPIALNTGANPIAIVITAQNGQTRTVTVTVNRQSGEAALRTLLLSQGTLTPPFTVNTLAYTLNVSQASSTLDLTAIPQDTVKAAMTLNGAALASNKATAVALGGGSVITLVVTAEDPAVSRSYTFTVNKVDDVPPTPPFVALGAFAAPDRPTWTWTTGGGGNGTFRYKLDNANLASGAITTTALTYTATADLAAGSHILYVQERDSAGNWSYSGTGVATITTLKPIADYPLTGHAMDTVGGNADLTIQNAPFLAQGIYVNGIASSTMLPNFSNAITPALSGFVTTNFSVEVEFKPDGIPASTLPILTGGNSFRWLGGDLDADGKVSLLYNNSNKVKGTQTCAAGAWSTLKLEYVGGVAKVYLNGVLSASATATLTFGSDYNFGSTNHSNGAEFKGNLRNLRVYASGVKIAHYPLAVDGADITKKQAVMSLDNTPFQSPGPGITLAGVYNGDLAITPNLTSMNMNEFKLTADFSIAALPATRIPIIVGGNSFRWLGALIEPSGNLTLLYNNTPTLATTVNCSVAAKHTVSIRYSAASQMASIYLDGALAGTQAIAALTHGDNKNIGTTNYGNGSAFKGTLYRLKVDSN